MPIDICVLGAVHMSRASPANRADLSHENLLLFNNITFYLASWQAFVLLKAPFTRAIFVWQFLCDEFYLLVYMRTFARILCGKCICRETSLPAFMWQSKIVNYEYLFVYMTRHIFVTCIYLHVCQALSDYNVALKTSFLRRVKKYLLYHLHEQSYLSCKIVKQKLLV